MSAHIIDIVFGWRKEDYDGYNDYYVNPEYHRCELIRRRSRGSVQEDEEQNNVIFNN